MPHIHVEDGQYDFTVSGHIVNQDRVLLIRHKKYPMWAPPSGHIELHQTPVEALFMEIREEAGIQEEDLTLVETYDEAKDFTRMNLKGTPSIRVPIPFDIDSHVVEGTAEHPTHLHSDFAYILTSTTDVVAPEEGESQEYKWFTDEELADFTDTTQTVIDRSRYAISYVALRNAE